jgi:hypothetical protein
MREPQASEPYVNPKAFEAKDPKVSRASTASEATTTMRSRELTARSLRRGSLFSRPALQRRATP